MLRNNYLYKYKEKNKLALESCLNQDDDNVILQKHRPLTERTIANLSSKNFQNFVDEILVNKNMSKVLFSSNAQKEIKLQREVINRTKTNKVKKKKVEEECLAVNIFKDRNKKETIAEIRKETSKFKESRSQLKNDLLDKVDVFYNKIRHSNREDKRRFLTQNNNERLQRIEKTFYGIKSKLERYYDQTQNYHNKLVLPDIQLNMSDVYSRLYHNAVLLTKTDRTVTSYLNTEATVGEDLNQMTIQSTSNTASNFVVKNVIEETNGKEFTVKITDEILAKCFSRHSGGPLIKIGKVSVRPDLKNPKGDEYSLNLLEIRNVRGDTLLHISAGERYIELVEYLLLKGVEVNVQNREGNTPMHLAMRNEDVNMIRILFDWSAKIDIPNKKNETAGEIASNLVRKIFKLEGLL